MTPHDATRILMGALAECPALYISYCCTQCGRAFQRRVPDHRRASIDPGPSGQVLLRDHHGKVACVVYISEAPPQGVTVEPWVWLQPSAVRRSPRHWHPIRHGLKPYRCIGCRLA